jgi:hypothetical protein
VPIDDALEAIPQADERYRHRLCSIITDVIEHKIKDMAEFRKTQNNFVSKCSVFRNSLNYDKNVRCSIKQSNVRHRKLSNCPEYECCRDKKEEVVNYANR